MFDYSKLWSKDETKLRKNWRMASLLQPCAAGFEKLQNVHKKIRQNYLQHWLHKGVCDYSSILTRWRLTLQTLGHCNTALINPPPPPPPPIQHGGTEQVLVSSDSGIFLFPTACDSVSIRKSLKLNFRLQLDNTGQSTYTSRMCWRIDHHVDNLQKFCQVDCRVSV